MRTIICKRCGAQIDAELGVCPNCGAVYYILPQEEATAQPYDPFAQSSPAADPYAQAPAADRWAPTRSAPDPFAPGQQPYDPFADHSTRQAELLNDDIFSTRVIDPIGKIEETQVFRSINEDSAGAYAASRPAPRQPAPRVQTASELAAENHRHQAPPPQKKGMDPKKKQFIVAGVALLALLVLVISAMSGLFNFGGKGSDGIMPPVEGMLESTAKQILENMGAKVTLDYDYDDVVKQGNVISQSVAEGKKVKKGDKITLVISKGSETPEEPEEEEPEYIEVPDLEDKTYDSARKLLTEMGLAISRGDDVFSELAEGRIVSQTPYKGAKLQKGEAVEVCLSKGLEPSPEPDSHDITVTAGTGGTISPKGLVSVSHEKDQSFTITPDEGYEIREVKVDGTSIGAVSSYTFTKVTSDHSIYAVFQKKAEPTPTPTPTPTSTPTPAPPTETTSSDINGGGIITGD